MHLPERAAEPVEAVGISAGVSPRIPIIHRFN
jgi:hypothetical protein